VLASPRFAVFDIRWLAHPGMVTVVHHQAQLHGTPGEQVSLLAVGGRASGVRTKGLRWPLTDETLEFGSSRGVSNEFSNSIADMTLETGVILAIQPHPS
jgi:thiamine pyrophosphokinase